MFRSYRTGLDTATDTFAKLQLNRQINQSLVRNIVNRPSENSFLAIERRVVNEHFDLWRRLFDLLCGGGLSDLSLMSLAQH